VQLVLALKPQSYAKQVHTIVGPRPHGAHRPIVIAIGNGLDGPKAEAPPMWEEPEVAAVDDDLFPLRVERYLAVKPAEGQQTQAPGGTGDQFALDLVDARADGQ